MLLVAWSRFRQPGIRWFSMDMYWKVLPPRGVQLYSGGLALFVAGIVVNVLSR